MSTRTAKAALLLVFAFVLLIVPVLVGAANRRTGGGPVDTQRFSWTSDTTRTGSKAWRPVRGLASVSAACPARGGATASVSMQLASDSAAAKIRVAMNTIGGVVVIGEPRPSRLMRPRYVATGELDVVSFDFVAPKIPGQHGATFQVQWRSASGGLAVLRKATLTVQFNDGGGSCI